LELSRKPEANYAPRQFHIFPCLIVVTILLVFGLIIITIIVLQTVTDTGKKVDSIGRGQDKE
jgi:hypothetical protein